MPHRKLHILLVVAVILAVSRIEQITRFLAERGLIDLAADVRAEYLPPVALTIIAVLLYVLPSARVTRAPGWERSSSRSEDYWPFA